MRRLLDQASWPLLAALGALLPPAVVLLSGHTLVWRDTAQLNAPLRPLVVDALRALRVPGWNPWEGAGQPLYAQLLLGVLHPVSVAVAAVTRSTDALIVALILTGCVGTWFAARALGASRPASAGAALAFSLSGYLLGMADNTSYLMPTATGPWVVAALAWTGASPLAWMPAAIAGASLALAGDPGSVFAFALVGCGLAFADGRWRGLLRAGIGSALGIALAAVQYLPSWLYMADTARGAGRLNPGDLHRWALAPWRLVELVAPGFFVGVPHGYDAPVFAALDGATPDRFPFTPSVFVGAAVVLLAVRGFREGRRGRWLAGFAVFFLWVALGHRAGAQELLSGIPVWGVLRYWEKMVGPLSLCLALAAGLGIDGLTRSPSRSWARAAGAAGALALGGAAALSAQRLSAVFPADPVASDLARTQLRMGLLNAAGGLLLLGAALWMARRLGARAPAVLVAIVFVESATASPFSLHLGDASALTVRPPALAAEPPGPRVVAPLGCDFAAGMGALDAIDLLNVCERRTGRPSTNGEARVASLVTYSSLTPGRWDLVYASGQLFWPLTRRYGTTHVLAREPATPPEGAVLEAATRGATAFRRLDGGNLLVWEVPHRPWASFAPSVRVAPGREAALATLRSEELAGSDTVVIETTGPAPQTARGRVLAVFRETEGVTVDAESDGEGLLVVNDAWSPGWKASIDGRETEVMPADVLVRAVRWPAGRHRLTMRYEVPGLPLGAAISGITLAAMLGVFLWQRRRLRAAGEQPRGVGPARGERAATGRA